MGVVFDPAKNRSNAKKHGVSLQRARDFDFNTALFDVGDSQDDGEVRYGAIGWLHALLYTLTFTRTGEEIRAISLRKASTQEQQNHADET